MDAGMDTANDEADVMSKGRLVKARFPDQPRPNVAWFWLQLGNCLACGYYQPPSVPGGFRCLNPKISRGEFLRYFHVNTCPEFAAGVSEGRAEREHDRLDVMIAAGLCPGEPSQKVEILQALPWTPERSTRAREQAWLFREQAVAADAGADRPESHHDDEVDLTDDLGPIPE